jgi:PAS domain S-box-containing protein
MTKHGDIIMWVDLAILALNTTSAVVVSILFTNPSINEEMNKITSNKDVLNELILEKESFIDTIDEKDDFILLQDTFLNIQETVIEANDPNSMLDKICHQFCEYPSFNVAWIGFAKYGDSELPISFFHDDAEPRFLSNEFITILDDEDPYSNGPSSQAMLTCKSVVIEDTQSDLRFSQWHSRAKFSQIKSVLALPMYLQEGDRPIGVITLYSQKTFTADSEAIPLLEEIVQTITAKITNLNIEIKQKALNQKSMRKLYIFEKIINTIPESIFWKDTNLRYLGANNAFLKRKKVSSVMNIYGKSDEELSWYPANSEVTISEKRALQENKNILNLVEQMDERWFKSSKLTFHDQNSNLLGLIGISTDITYQHNIALELKHNENLYHNILDKIPDLAIVYFDKDRKIIKWNVQNTLMFGYSKEIALGEKIETLLYPKELQKKFISKINSWLDINRAIETAIVEFNAKDNKKVKIHAEYILQNRNSDNPVFIGVYTKA